MLPRPVAIVGAAAHVGRHLAARAEQAGLSVRLRGRRFRRRGKGTDGAEMSLTAVSEKKAAVLDATRAFGVMLGGALILAVAAAASVGEHFIMERKMLLGIKERAERARKEESR